MSKAKAKSKIYRKELSLALKERTKKTKKPKSESEECRKFKELEDYLTHE